MGNRGAKEYRVSFGGNESALILIVVMVTQFCEYTPPTHTTNSEICTLNGSFVWYVNCLD